MSKKRIRVIGLFIAVLSLAVLSGCGSAKKKQKISVKIESDFLINAVCRENQGSIFTFF